MRKRGHDLLKAIYLKAAGNMHVAATIPFMHSTKSCFLAFNISLYFFATDVYQESIGKKSTKRRELDNDALRLELSGVIEHVRIRHLLPIHGDLLESAMRKGLVERGMPLDIGEGSFYPCSPWMRKQGEKGFVRPRLFMPYYEESKVAHLSFQIYIEYRSFKRWLQYDPS